jgi:hypothetical protein
VSTRYVYVDETKRTGYVLAAVTITDPAAARKTVRGLMLPRQSRLHMVRENPARKAQIVAAVLALGVTATIYDAGRHHPSELAARRACLDALATDLAGDDTLLTIERDDGLVRTDQAPCTAVLTSMAVQGACTTTISERVPSRSVPCLT